MVLLRVLLVRAGRLGLGEYQLVQEHPEVADRWVQEHPEVADRWVQEHPEVVGHWVQEHPEVAGHWRRVLRTGFTRTSILLKYKNNANFRLIAFTRTFCIYSLTYNISYLPIFSTSPLKKPSPFLSNI